MRVCSTLLPVGAVKGGRKGKWPIAHNIFEKQAEWFSYDLKSALWLLESLLGTLRHPFSRKLPLSGPLTRQKVSLHSEEMSPSEPLFKQILLFFFSQVPTRSSSSLAQFGPDVWGAYPHEERRNFRVQAYSLSLAGVLSNHACASRSIPQGERKCYGGQGELNRM